jgi:glycosidase
LLEEVLQHDWLFPHPDSLVTFLGNHDTRRFMGEAGATPQKLELAFALLLTMRGIPQIYAGDEIGMPGGEDPDNRRDFPGGFPGDTHNAFTQEGRTADEQQIFNRVRGLLQLRKQHPALRRGEYIHIFSDETTFVFLRDFHETNKENGKTATPPERLLMLMNNADQSRVVSIDTHDTVLAQARVLTKVLAEHDGVLTFGSKIEVELPARSLCIYQDCSANSDCLFVLVVHFISLRACPAGSGSAWKQTYMDQRKQSRRRHLRQRDVESMVYVGRKWRVERSLLSSDR